MGGALAGLLGVDAGIAWTIGGVWLVRAVWGRRPGLGWGLALVAAGFRWGTLGLGDVQAATRALGPTVAAGSVLAIAGSSLAFASAFLEESAADGLRSRSVAERGAGAVAVLALVPAFVAPGPGEPSMPLSLAWWAGAAFVLVGAALALAPLARRIPSWAPPFAAGAGALLIGGGLR